MESIPTNNNFGQEHKESTLLVLLSYLKRKSTYNTSIEPILLQLHKRKITENVGAALLREELKNDAIGFSFLESYLQESMSASCSLEICTETHSINVVGIEEVLCNDSEFPEIISSEYVTI